MLTENFSSIELGDAAAYAPYFRALPLHAADYTFTNLWGWGTHYNLEWRTAHGLCWIRQKRNDLPVERLWAPVGDWYAADWAAMPELVPGTTILRAPEPLCELLLERLPGRVAIEETPGQWEYLYTQEALSTLAGNKLHKKKNHVNGYMKAYGEDYRALNGEIMPQVLALQDDWCKWRAKNPLRCWPKAMWSVPCSATGTPCPGLSAAHSMQARKWPPSPWANRSTSRPS